MTSPQLAIIYVETLPASTFDEFRRVVDHEKLALEVESRPEFGPVAGIEWLLPTAVFVYLGKSYFDGFLKEMGKDHYALLKTGLKSLYSALLGAASPKVQVIGTAGKVSKNRRYSLLYSVIAEADAGLKFKLLLPQSCTEAEYEATLVAFLGFLDHFYGNTLDEETIARISSVKPMSGTILVWHNPETALIEPVDPMQRDA
jgi:hypothetical protein